MIRILIFPLAAATLLTSQILTNDDIIEKESKLQLEASIVLSIAGYFSTLYLIPRFKIYFIQKGLFGKDLGKRGLEGGDTLIPEAMGVIPATVFLMCIIFLQIFLANDRSQLKKLFAYLLLSFTLSLKMVDFHSALLSVCFMILLGFADDVLDLPWRYKLVLPTVATLPLLCAYKGSRSILLPPIVYSLYFHLPFVSETVSFFFNVSVSMESRTILIDLGILYLIYMGMLSVFCTNAVNIYAGINGLEAGQCLVIAFAILIYNMIEILCERDTQNHLFSAEMMITFIGVTLALLKYNAYPAKVFVGDTFCYFAGMAFAVAGIHGHFSKTLILMFLPQWVNFFFSIPQLFKILPCPRHRIPRVDPATGLLHPSTTQSDYLSRYPLLKSGEPGNVINLTLINLALKIVGPTSEKKLSEYLIIFQMFMCILGFFIRYTIVTVVYH